jgi:hypothetical protein
MESMAANPSKIATLASPEADNSNNDSKQLSGLAKAKQEKEGKDAFEQFQHDLLVQNPTLASEQNQEIEPFTTIFSREITNLTISYMRDSEIPRLGAITPSILFACRFGIYEMMRFRKLVSENLLPHVFAANPDGVDAFLRTSGIHPKILLTESHYARGYVSQKSKGVICFERYKAVSALVGAYRCADFRFGRRILAHLLRDNNLSHEKRDGLRVIAREQLIELSERIGPPINAETVATKTSAVTTMANANASAAAAPTAATVTAVSPNDTASNKEKAEFNSGSSANTDKFADSDKFLSAIVKLINAYNAYISQYNSLFNQNNSEEIDRLWREVCECQKRLYHYVHLEFFGPIPFSPLPEFIAEPPRGPCRYYNNELLNLDEIGCDTSVGLYKGAGFDPRVPYAPAAAPPVRTCLPRHAGRFGTLLDLMAISHLYKLRVADLRNTIDQLHSLEAALTFLNDIKPSPHSLVIR